jgi:prepilin peptidase CpaA
MGPARRDYWSDRVTDVPKSDQQNGNGLRELGHGGQQHLDPEPSGTVMMPIPYAVALLVSVVACVTDVRTRRIPNVLTFGGALTALVFHGASGGMSGLESAASGWLVGLGVFFLPFALGGMGGGDVKLMAALGAWCGPLTVLWLAAYTGIAGALVALVVAAVRGYLPTALRNIWLLVAHWRVAGLRPLQEVSLAGSESPRLAYAVPILIGTVITVWLR